jgi:hypothetical protein
MNIYEALRAGILSKKPCKIAKPNEPERMVCLYLIGKSSKGQVNILYYQFGGYSKRGLREDGSSANWRCSCIAEIASAETLDEPWHQPIQKPKTRGSCVVSIDAEVEGYY